MNTYYVWTIGCQMNYADSWQLEQELRRLGYSAASRAEKADLVVLNTCVVRQHAEDKCQGRLTSLIGWKRSHPGRMLVVMGCLVGDLDHIQRAHPHVDLFLKPSDYMGLIHYLCDHDLLPQEHRPADEEPVPVTRSVPISSGCDHHCTYCIVRLRRGPERSRPMAEIVSEIESLVRRGVREVTLLGQNVDSYGHDLELDPALQRSPHLADLLTAVQRVDGLLRVRFLTSHPADMRPELIDAVASSSVVCPHFELPIQAGDDLVLQRMGRGYTVAQYCDLVARIRERIPHSSIATDIIVGFPGESEAQFQATHRLLGELRFDAVHVAAYSERPGTPAARLQDDVPTVEKERRRQAVETLQAKIVGEINSRLMGQTVELLVEERRKGRWGGRTRTNKLVFAPDTGNDLRGRLVSVRVTWTGPWSLIGDAVP